MMMTLSERKRVVSLEVSQLEQAMRKRPTHRRCKSLCWLDTTPSGGGDGDGIIIYGHDGNERDQAISSSSRWPGHDVVAGRVTTTKIEDVAHCDNSSCETGNEREFYLLKDNGGGGASENFNSAQESRVAASGHKSDNCRRIKDESDDKDAQDKSRDDVTRGKQSTPSRTRTTPSTSTHQIDKKLARNFKLKWLLAKAKSLAASYLLHMSVIFLVIASQHQQTSALVINVGTAAATSPRDQHQHQRQHQRQHQYHQHNHDAIRSNQTWLIRTRRAAGDRSAAAAAPLERSAKLLELDALNYLQRYGYMNSSSGQSSSSGSQSSNAINLISEDSFHDAIMQFQRFAGIPETGSVDQLTVKYMQMPRCGNKDMSGKGENGKRKRKKRRRRRKRYALQGSKWRRQELTYRISQYPTRFAHKKHEVDGQIERAFKIWSKVAPIDFVVKRDGRVHIDIRFANGEHGDGDPFDGPGNTLAHAYFPQYGGDAHFDDQEYWTVDSYAGTNIFQVAAHELGHSLGLGHSSVREALMAPFYQKYKPNFKLHADDVLAIQALYGERNAGDSDNDSPPVTPSTSTSTTTETSVSRRRPPPSSGGNDDDEGGGGGFFGFGGGGNSPAKPVDLCQDSRIDAVTRTEDGSTYVFRGQHYWQIKNEGLASGSPGRISRDWDGLPGNLDAALTWSDGKTFFFKGDKYWRFLNKRREPGYPKLISVGFAGIPNNLDAAFVWSGNGKTYFFKRDKYWRFDSKQEPPVSGQYPKPLKNWVGLPSAGIDAAFKWENGMTYFFKDDLYYRFDDREFEVDTSARPPFPRSVAEWWFGCTNSNLPIRRLPANGQSGAPETRSSDGALEASESSQQSSSSLAPPSLLLFHRKPNLSYESATPSRGGAGGGGSSITRSIISSLSALFPSSSDSVSDDEDQPRSSASNSQAAPDLSSSALSDWSFHRGLGEEARRLVAKSGRAVPTSGVGASDSSRWAFPLSSLASNSGSSLSGSDATSSRASPSPDNSSSSSNNNNRGIDRNHNHHLLTHDHDRDHLYHHHHHHQRQPHVSREQSMSELRLAPQQLQLPPGQDLLLTPSPLASANRTISLDNMTTTTTTISTNSTNNTSTSQDKRRRTDKESEEDDEDEVRPVLSLALRQREK